MIMLSIPWQEQFWDCLPMARILKPKHSWSSCEVTMLGQQEISLLCMQLLCVHVIMILTLCTCTCITTLSICTCTCKDVCINGIRKLFPVQLKFCFTCPCLDSTERANILDRSSKPSNILGPAVVLYKGHHILGYSHSVY